jgi:hypothetical protein
MYSRKDGATMQLKWLHRAGAVPATVVSRCHRMRDPTAHCLRALDQHGDVTCMMAVLQCGTWNPRAVLDIRFGVQPQPI